MNDKGDTRGDLRLPEGELGEKIREDFDKDISLMVSWVQTSIFLCWLLTLPSSWLSWVLLVRNVSLHPRLFRRNCLDYEQEPIGLMKTTISRHQELRIETFSEKGLINVTKSNNGEVEWKRKGQFPTLEKEEERTVSNSFVKEEERTISDSFVKEEDSFRSVCKRKGQFPIRLFNSSATFFIGFVFKSFTTLISSKNYYSIKILSRFQFFYTNSFPLLVFSIQNLTWEKQLHISLQLIFCPLRLERETFYDERSYIDSVIRKV